MFFLNLTFQLFIFISSLAYVLFLWKSEPGEKKNKYSELFFLRMSWLSSFLCFCCRHKASVSISCRSFSPGHFHSKVNQRIHSHLAIEHSNSTFIMGILLLNIMDRPVLFINIINYISNSDHYCFFLYLVLSSVIHVVR
jgi:hypothetical protein